MHYVIAYIALYIGSLVLGVVWNLVLFKAQYEAAVGDTLRAAPIFPIGLFAVALNCAAILTVFSWLYPGGFRPALAIALMALLWTPNLVNSFAGAAKLKIAQPASYLTLETGFSALNIVVLGLVLAATFAWFAPSTD